MKTNYKKMSEKQLQDALKELEMRQVKSFIGGKKEKQENRSRIRREIAKIKTEENRRRNEKNIVGKKG